MSNETIDDQSTANNKKRPRIAVLYGVMGAVGEFTCRPDTAEQIKSGADVVIQSDRGIELGKVLGLMTTVSHSKHPDAISVQSVRQFLNNSGNEYMRSDAGKILRLATDQDINESHHLAINHQHERRTCQEFADRLELKMKVIAAEHLLGGERIVFYFMAEGRIDFRELVRQLAHEFQTRIEMRQVGARDEARLLADYEICGRQCCCKNFLKTLRPINMRMAKVQKATLDPTKVSGRCGRLRCCLRYEFSTYEDLARQLPRINSRVSTPAGPGVVREHQVLTQLVMVSLEESGQRMTFPVEELERMDGKSHQRSREDQDSDHYDPEDAAADDDDAGDSDNIDESGENQNNADRSRRSGRSGRRSRRRRPRKNSGNDNDASDTTDNNS